VLVDVKPPVAEELKPPVIEEVKPPVEIIAEPFPPATTIPKTNDD